MQMMAGRPQPLAHVSEDGMQHLLIDHLADTAQLASDFAAGFGCGGWT